jgi:hypothetical protein
MSSSIIISWDESADKKVKSSDDKDLGKVQNVTKDYIQTKEGAVLKKSYFIPKYYVQGYDGDSIWVSLRKDEVKERFERENPPEDISEFETPDYMQRRESIKKQYPEFDNNIPRYTPIPGASSAGGATTAVATPTPSTTRVNVPWEKVKGKKAKSIDDKDLGKVEDIAPHYVEVKEGLIGKKSYFIPKHYINYFDGDNLHTSLTKDEVKSKYERDSPPSESDIQTQYLEQKNKIESEQPQSLHGVPFMARESGVTSRSDLTGEELNIEWAEVIHKHVRAADDVDMGDVQRVGNEFIVVRQGVAKVHLYFIPKVCISNYDGSSLYLNVPSNFVRSRFERESEPTTEEIRTLAKEAGEGKVRDAAKEDKPMSGSSKGTSKYEEGVPGTKAGRKEDPLTGYREKEPMTPAKIKEHEPTAVKRDPSDQKIAGPGQQGDTSPEEAREKARRSGMTKGTAGADETGSEYEQGAAGANK